MRERYRTLLSARSTAGLRFARAVPRRHGGHGAAGLPVRAFLPGLGQDFFPAVDAGQIKLHLRAARGMRIEETAALCDRVEATIRDVIPADEIDTIVDNIGLPYSGINLAYSTSAPVGPGMRTSS